VMGVLVAKQPTIGVKAVPPFADVLAHRQP
jgi:hypothetical protein